MRFNKQELMTLATQPSQKFEKEGILYVRERQEGFFRRTESTGKNLETKKQKGKKHKILRDFSCVSASTSKVSLERWCRLRGNLLFYFKSREQWSEPLGVIILEQFSIRVEAPNPQIPYGFSIVFDGGVYQQLGANTSEERDGWLQSLQLASYECMRSQLLALRQRMETTCGHKHDADIQMLRLKRGIVTDPSEIPLCEVSLSCDNLLCDGHGRPPNPVLEVDIRTVQSGSMWIKYARSEVVERSSNPSFLTTVSFRSSDGIGPETRIRITAHDVRERVSQTATPIGSAVIAFSAVQDTPRLRIPLKSAKSTTVGFLTINVWNLEVEDKGNSTESTPSRNVPTSTSNPVYCHRRSQSLPPRLGTKIKLPHQGQLKLLFANPFIQTYRFHSGLGGDICVHETMTESKLCFLFPQQLLGIWIQEEKELLQEVAGMGELREPWHSKQVELLDRHLHLLHLYSQAKENLAAFKGSYFKQSSRKNDRSLEFAPLNLHLQRMWVHNDTLNKCGLYDFVSVGAFTAHSHKSKNGGLLRLVQALKESPVKCSQLYQGTSKISMAHDAIQAIKQLRRDIVDAMRTLMKLAKDKQTSGMLPICEEMITKTRILLSLWDPGLVEEALSFLEEHKVPKVQEDTSNDSMTLDFRSNQTLSPFKRITQQLNFDLKSPDFDEFVTPDTPVCVQDLWAKESTRSKLVNFALKNNEINSNIQKCQTDNNFVIFPEVDDEPKEIDTTEVTSNVNNKSEDNNNHNNLDDDLGKAYVDRLNDTDQSKRFLDTQKMCNSPSANYYKPTDEPEPWDLTQLNIEASVMCLVSKVKFLCGRCSSPAVRLRNKNGIDKHQKCISNSVNTDSTNLGLPAKNGIKQDDTKNDTRFEKLNKLNSESFSTDNPTVIYSNSYSEKMCQGNDATPRTSKPSVVQRNKFTEGLDFASIHDWPSELRPSMKKLRQAMDGLLKTARLTHSVFRVQEDAKSAQRMCNVRYRRDVCFSQALTALVSGLMAKLWCQRPDPMFLLILSTLGPLVSFEGLLSYYGDEIDMWGDMTVAVEDMHTVTFTLSRCGIQTNNVDGKPPNIQFPLPRVTGSRSALTVLLPVPDSIYSLLPLTSTAKTTLSFNVTPVFFNIGINEMASLAESLGTTKPQEKSNQDNFDRLNNYYLQYKKLNMPMESSSTRYGVRLGIYQSLAEMMANLKTAVQARVNKNVEVLQLTSQICRRMRGLRFTSCKSAKDRTGMSITLEQVNILSAEYHLAEHEFAKALDCMRSEGCRRENTWKNIGVRKFAFNSLQIMTLPKQYRPPTGTYGSAQT
ncbi:type I inositol 3,4-bisphosphate 4-phosphatase isoform X1 [Trichogramma pretiosum]|uniref:type I inositol 3,4-bisphosphate 4-phosphatase isoform X1 n=1 Tax=Trichogramma pretiosum TaxID=7493 RepID=UPI0006C97092|nr:type I inositol 3,4-bisphosphate 4-phosphatase isoform X1 [Trichogramma pretiosum]XP_014221742.1 type I inositol 3,4-bisphosphate 4-phosphatase isoform X1 [Trichogramma pretiosum]XP_023314322.1 type I inositol 3,4-bisphosphate 4-phosphatase isoform X1 [Trichogramma pretiosum]